MNSTLALISGLGLGLGLETSGLGLGLGLEALGLGLGLETPGLVNIPDFSNVRVQLRRHTLTASHLVDDDIDTWTMEEARNLNFCWTNGGGASELQHKIV